MIPEDSPDFKDLLILIKEVTQKYNALVSE